VALLAIATAELCKQNIYKEEASALATLGALLRYAVSLPAAAPRATASHPGAAPFLVACLDGKHKSDRGSSTVRGLSSYRYGGSVPVRPPI
jgi:hypothetical protein